MASESLSSFLVVCGGPLNKDGAPGPWLLPRLEMAADIAMGTGDVKMPIDMIICTGYQNEGATMVRWLAERGVLEDRLVVEPHACNTVENAWFASKLICEIVGSKREEIHVSVLSSEFHIPRCRMVFDGIFGAQRFGNLTYFGAAFPSGKARQATESKLLIRFQPAVTRAVRLLKACRGNWDELVVDDLYRAPEAMLELLEMGYPREVVIQALQAGYQGEAAKRYIEQSRAGKPTQPPVPKA